MPLTNQPYLPLFVQDWLTNSKLKYCSMSANGLMINIMCVMHKEKDYGTILLKQKYKHMLDDSLKRKVKRVKNFACQLSVLFPFSLQEIESALDELINEDVLKINDDILLCNRMVRDAKKSVSCSESGREGGKQTQKKHRESNSAKANIEAIPTINAKANIKATPKVNAKAKVEAISENENENASAIENTIDIDNEILNSSFK